MTSNVALIVEDDPNTADAFSKMLSGMGYTAHIAQTLEEATSRLGLLSPAVVLLDVGLPDGNGLSLLREHSANGKISPKFVVITGDNSQNIAVECLRAQVDDFLTKPVSLQSLRGCFGKLSSSQKPANDGVHNGQIGVAPALDHQLSQETVLFTGNSRAVKQLRQDVTDCAMSRLNAVITGGAGAYKQNVAYAVHRQSRRKGMFISLNGGDFTATSANINNRTESDDQSSEAILKNSVDAARNGTLLINDLSSVPMNVQHQLLKWCDSNQSSRMLSQHPILIVTLHGQPHAEIEAGRLSAELYYRLAQYVIRVPDLKERVSDLPEMLAVIVSELNRSYRVRRTLAPTEISRLQTYDWPGNVRELKNVVNQSFASRAPTFSIANHLVPATNSADQADSAIEAFVGKTFWETEKTLLFATLESVNGDKSAAADMLGISLKTLYNRLNAYS